MVASQERALHIYHLLGRACLMLDDFDEALRVLRLGAALEKGSCDLSLLLAVVEPLVDDPPLEDISPAAERPVRRLRYAIRRADACLANGDAADIRRTMPERLVLDTAEVQSMARLAVGYLAFEPKTTVDRFTKAFVLASYCECNAERTAFVRHELPLREGRWDTARLDSVEAQAMAWLNENFGGPNPIKMEPT